MLQGGQRGDIKRRAAPVKLLRFLEGAKYEFSVAQQHWNLGKSIANTLTYILETCRCLDSV